MPIPTDVKLRRVTLSIELLLPADRYEDWLSDPTLEELEDLTDNWDVSVAGTRVVSNTVIEGEKDCKAACKAHGTTLESFFDETAVNFDPDA